MDAERIGKLISKIRKEKNLTQQQLADVLGVSYKTISKWECGSGFPDISMIKKIAEELDISVEELLDGNKKENKKKKFGVKFFILASIVILLFSLLIVILNKNDYNNIQNGNTSNRCKVIRTYYIDNINRSNDDDYVYVTLHEYQVEGTFTIKLSNLEGSNLVIGNSYEFTFDVFEEYVSTTTDILFDNGNIIGIEYSDKVGLDRVSKYSCN